MTTDRTAAPEAERLRDLLQRVVEQVEGCHDCFSLSAPDDLQAEVYRAIGRTDDT